MVPKWMTTRMLQKYIVVLFITIVFAGGCKPAQYQYAHYHRRAENYFKKYGSIQRDVDTTILSGRLTRLYRKGNLFRIGKVLDESKYNEYYEFSGSNLIAVVSCKADSCSVKMLANRDW